MKNELLELIAPDHDYVTCSDTDLCNYNRVCVRCNLLEVLAGYIDPEEYDYSVIIRKKKFCECPDCQGHWT